MPRPAATASRRTASRRRPARAAPPTPPPSAAQRADALAAAHRAATGRWWGGPGSTVAVVKGVELRAALVTRERPHWHLLTAGLARAGVELSLRVARGKDEAAAPPWAVSLLRGLAERTLGGEVAPDALQCLTPAGGLGPEGATDLAALAFTVDPELHTLQTPFDTVPVLQAVPVTADEARVMREWSPPGLVEVLARVSPLLVTELERPSLLQSPRARQFIEQRVAREGSSLATLTAETSRATREGDVVTWRLSQEAVEPLTSLLKGRIGHLRGFTVRAGAATVEVVSADAPAVDLSPRSLTLRLSQPAARQLRATLRATPGTYTVEQLPKFALTVV